MTGTSAVTRDLWPPPPKWRTAPTSALRPSAATCKPLNIGPQPPAQQVNWLNLFYSVEWVVFAGFALFIWWRLVKDDYRRDLEEDSTTTCRRGHAATLRPSPPNFSNSSNKR